MKNTKKIISILLASIFVLSGCAKLAVDNGENMKIRWLGSPNMAVDSGNNIEKFLNEKYNVKIESISITSNYNEKVGAMLATGDVPDVIFLQEPELWQPLAKQGILAEVGIDVIKKNAPNLYKATNELNEAIWSICEIDGVNYVLPRYTGKEYNTASIWRQDWMEKVGVTTIPTTLAEFEAVLSKFRNEDPDGNGKKDTYGFTGMGNHQQRQFDTIFGAYGIMPGQWCIQNEKIINGTIAPQTKEALILLNDWYKKELIDPEFITDSIASVNEKYNAGRIGLMFSSAANYMDCMPSGKSAINDWKARNPNAKISVSAMPKGANGEQGDWLWGPRSNFIAFGSQLEKDPAKMEKVIQMLDDLFSNEELTMKVVWGEKGVTYDYNDPAIGAESGLKYLPPYDTDPAARSKEGIGQGGFYNMLQPVSTWAKDDHVNKYLPKEFVEFNAKNASLQNYKDAILRAPLPSATLSQANLDKMKTTNFSAFITGTRPISEWNAFIQEWLNAGGKKLTEEAQSYYDKNIKK